MNHTDNYSIDNMIEEIEKFTRLQMDYREQTLAKIITRYDFIVGSIECKRKLMKALPEEANIICSPYIIDPQTIYAIKRFDIMDFIRSESEEN